jgi:AraC-like DNA-binding protein
MTHLGIISTNDVAPAEKFGLWRETLWQLFGRLRSQAYGDKSFAGSIEHCDLGDLRICKIVARRHRVVRTPAGRHDNQDLLKVVVQLKGTSRFEQNGRSMLLTPGYWSIYDTTRPYIVSNLENVEHLTLLIPRARIATQRLNLNDLVMRRFSGDVGLGRIAHQFITTVFAEIPNVNPEHEWEIVGAISQLIRLAMLEVSGSQTDLSLRETWRERIKTHIEEHLRDPDLCLDQIATALNCSKRYIHKIFESEGTSTSEYIWRMRLGCCRKELCDPACAGKSITEIAYTWGFSNSAHFSRAFKDEFQLSPRSFRVVAHCTETNSCSKSQTNPRVPASTPPKLPGMMAQLRQLKAAGVH